MARLRRYRALIAAALAACLAPALHAADPVPSLHDRPILTLDPGMHTAPIRRADMDAAGRIAVTGSLDRTIRIWSVEKGRLLRTIRVPTGPGDVGKIYAVAISPDGATIAAGGWTRWTDADRQDQIYFFDSETGTLIQRIDGLPSGVLHLAFSPDGTRLVAMLWGSNGMRLYERLEERQWQELARDTDYANQSYGAAFAPDGRFATTSYDDRIRLYDRDGRWLRSVEAPADDPYGIAFNPNDGRLAVGTLLAPELHLLEGDTLAPLPQPDLSGLSNGSLPIVAWSYDGTTLFAGGSYDDGGPNPVIAWGDRGAGSPRKLSAGSDSLMSLMPLRYGGLVAAAQDPWLGRLDATGASAWSHGPVTFDARDQWHNLSVSADGSVIVFGYQEGGGDRARFDVGTLSLKTDPPADEHVLSPRQDGLEIADWVNGFRPSLNGETLPLEAYERSRSLAIGSEAKRFVLGTEWALRAFDAKGAPLWRKSAPGIVWAVNITRDNRLVIAAYGDGSIRWHRMDSGEEILALFPFNDGSDRWVLWTPEGYYAASPGAAEALGWTVNRGWDRAADFFPITAFGGFFAPDALRHVPQTMETASALGLAKIARDRKYVQQVVDSPAPPGPQLHVLTIGISRYTNHARLNLDFADDDATGLARALLQQDAGLYARVNMADPLIDEKATRARILEELRALERRMAPDQQDVAVILFSGHGTKVAGEYYLLPTDVDASDEAGIEATGLYMDRVLKLIGRMGEKGKVLVLLDACHSGAVTDGARTAAPPDIADVREALAAAGNGVIVLSSSTGTQVSREHPDWQQGAFTKAVLEALAGQGDSDGDGWLSVAELEEHVVAAVGDLTGNAQTPVVTVPGGRHYQARLFRTAF